MKKSASFILAAVMIVPCILTCFCLPSSAEGLAYPSALDGIENVMLMYTFAQQGAVSGRHTVESLLPYVGYYNTDNKLTDIFFDSFLLLPCVTTGPSGGTMYISKDPAVASDWQAYRDDVFADGYNLDALNTAVGQVKNLLGMSDYKARVFFTVSYPNDGQTGFGSIGGREYDFSILQDRIDYCKWQIDDYLARFDSGNYENLEVAGFYWFEEFIHLNSQPEKELITSTTSYIRRKGYKSIWIPYYLASGWNKWKEYGFDVACLQPNYMFNSDAESGRIKDAVEKAKNYGMCNEVEISGKVLTSAEYYNRYLTYLRDFTSQGAVNAVKMYYQDLKFYYECYKSEIPEVRLLYDLTYKYAAGTLKDADIADKYITAGGVSANYNIVSAGCFYTASKPYTDSALGYSEIDGKELTDCVYASANYGTEWHAFYKQYTESDGNFQVVLDLGGCYNDLEYIYMEFREDIKASVGLPEKVDFYISADGINFTHLCETTPSGAVIGADAAKYENGRFTARYIKAVFPPNPETVFVFVSELAVGSGKNDISLGEGYNIISEDCSYTASAPYTDTSEWNAPYMQISGKELTDGILGSSSHGTEWHDMYSKYLAEGERFFVNVDLGENRTDISYIGMQFGHDLSSGIAKPNTVTYYISSDGKQYNELGTVSVVLGNDGYAYGIFVSDVPLKGRYIKAEFDSGKCVHNFVSELAVGAKKDAVFTVGDINNSGSYEIADYLLARRIISGTVSVSSAALAAADADLDGIVTSEDCGIIKEMFIGTNG